jgi:hypothetical protein
MTITVSIEELRDFESRMIKWGTERAFHFKSVMDDNHFGRNVDLMDAMKAWDLSHPIPKLIPNI